MVVNRGTYSAGTEDVQSMLSDFRGMHALYQRLMNADKEKECFSTFEPAAED